MHDDLCGIENLLDVSGIDYCHIVNVPIKNTSLIPKKNSIIINYILYIWFDLEEIVDFYQQISFNSN